ncbi:single-stranded DNA-binding protein [[Clostridium] polysaccharolyticum]|uniref:Single-stranded DNA-binding protein n=1 Tax=[Clostridium] polysaccharolyticum TaxID=29364 RepID=A0A1H9YJR4_9FIRM|nr:single-stranded DNA-binding protein [[Clostridium] polysaccharolyticum]SES69234.1 single-strand DNA-binding protein [[Clostridium] polysaccharolyticum]
MNKVSLVGRLTRDPDIRYSQESSMCVASFSVAVDRRFKRQGEQEADFISCKAFGKTAEFIQNYFFKGMKIGLTGRIQTGSYTNREGQKVYTTDVVAEEVEFVESKNNQNQGQQGGYQQPAGGFNPQNANGPSGFAAGDGFMNIPDGIDEELPFN